MAYLRINNSLLKTVVLIKPSVLTSCDFDTKQHSTFTKRNKYRSLELSKQFYNTGIYANEYKLIKYRIIPPNRLLVNVYKFNINTTIAKTIVLHSLFCREIQF